MQKKIHLLKIIGIISFLILNLSSENSNAQSHSDSKLEFSLHGINIVKLKKLDSYNLYVFATNTGNKPIKLNRFLASSDNFVGNGLSYELEIYKNKKFIPYFEDGTFKINDVNPGAPRIVSINNMHRYRFLPFEVYTPDCSGWYRVRIKYEWEKEINFSEWFYIYVYEKKKEIYDFRKVLELIYKTE